MNTPSPLPRLHGPMILGLFQLFLFAVIVLTLNLFPPASGDMVLVPITDDAARSVSRIASSGDTRLMGRGPWQGSLIVRGDRPDLTKLFLKEGILALAATTSVCGSGGNV